MCLRNPNPTQPHVNPGGAKSWADVGHRLLARCGWGRGQMTEGSWPETRLRNRARHFGVNTAWAYPRARPTWRRGWTRLQTDTAMGRPHVFVAAVLLAVRRPQSDAAPPWEPGRVGSGSGDRSICSRDERACAGVHARGTVVCGTRCVLAPVSIDSDSSASPVISTKSHGRLPARTPVHAGKSGLGHDNYVCVCARACARVRGCLCLCACVCARACACVPVCV